MKKHYDVCVAGFWYGANYGSLLNGYAEYRILKDMGKEVLMLQKPITPTAPKVDREITDGHNVRFVNKYYDPEDISPQLTYSQLESLNELCDCFCAGSDQIWNYNLSFHENLYLPFVHQDKRLISFATSFGHKVDKTPIEARERIKDYLQRYNALSVREKFDVDILEDNYGLKGELVFEPVFCINKEHYEKLAEQSSFSENEPYMLTYILDPTPEKREAILYYGEQLGIKTVNILNGVQYAWEKNNQLLNLPNTLENVETEDFIKAFMNADYVITDSFHGSAFSIIFNKPFLAIGNYGRGYERFVDLLGRLKLSDRLISTPNSIPHEKKYLSAIDYSETNKIIAQETKRTVEWLKKALEIPITEMKSTSIKLKDIETNMDMKNCTGCGCCANICPVHAISMRKNSEGFLNPQVDYTKCINCGLCDDKCPSLKPQYENQKNPKCYAVMADDDIREKSSSGGVFAVLAQHVLDKMGYVCGAAYDDEFNVKHIMIDNQDDLYKLQGSKYIQSNTSETYKEVKEKLDQDSLILYTGMPCQIAGLKAYLGKEYNNLYTVDLLCHGICSHKVFKKYCEEVHTDKNISDVKFKEKKPWGWHAGLNVYYSDGTKYAEPLERDPYLNTYLKSISKNSNCGVCKFNALPRQGDITIGDFWRIEKFEPSYNDNKGTSVVLLNNEKGERIFNDIRNLFKLCEKAPLEIAKQGNGIISHTYALNKYRNLFYEFLDDFGFMTVANGCRNNRLYDEIYTKKVSSLDPKMQMYYWLARTTVKKAGDRKIVVWGGDSLFSQILKNEFGKSVVTNVTMRKEWDNGKTTRYIGVLRHRSKEFFVVCLGKKYEPSDEKIFSDYGYLPEKDFIYRIHKPIVIEDFDCSKSVYFDDYGNTIEGISGVIKKIVFRGCNNHIMIGENVSGLSNLDISMCENSILRIGDGCKFGNDITFSYADYRGSSSVTIKNNCTFSDHTKFVLFNDDNNSSVLINEKCWFGSHLEIHANLGKKVIIGRECLFSHNIDVWAGDGHSLFDVSTGKRTNGYNIDSRFGKNQTVIGNHVWVGKGAFIIQGTNIGLGSTIGAMSVVKGIFPNNCTIAGNPATMVKINTAWSGKREADDIEKDIPKEYRNLTSNSSAAISGRKVLVIGGTKFMGIQLVKKLIELGNDVTIATRGRKKDSFGVDVKRIIMDVSDKESVERALTDRYFDVVFDNLAYCSNYVRNVLSVVRCGKYIQLSSVESYTPTKIDLKETDFDPYHFKQKWCDVNIGYQEGKKQAEAAVYQMFPNVSAITVRIPYVTPTDRLLYYCKHIVNQTPMSIDDVSRGFTFIRDTEVAQFLPWIAAQNFEGSINLASTGFVTIKMILEYIEHKVGKKAIIDVQAGDESPFHVFHENSFSMNMEKAKQLGYIPSNINSWFWTVMDSYIERALKEK